MNCLIIDDSPKTSEILQLLLADVRGIGTIHKAVQPYLVRSLMATERIDIIFTRVRLWDPFVFARLENMPPIAFLSGGRDKLTNQAGTTVPYKLREPYTLMETEQLVRNIINTQIIESADYFFVRYDGHFHRLFIRDIEMVERMKMGFIKVYTRYTSVLITHTLTNFLKLLPEGKFIRVSDTLILPIEQVKTIDSDQYTYRGRTIKLTYRFAASARKELEKQSDWAGVALQ